MCATLPPHIDQSPEFACACGSQLPPQTQSAARANPLSYDLDGNLKSDGLWNYMWDAENRLIQMTSASQVADAGKRQLDFRYDHLGRRFKKTVKTYSS